MGTGTQQQIYRPPVKGFAKVPHAIYDMQLDKKVHAIAVFTFLWRRLNNKTQRCNPSLKDIAGHLDISERQVTRVLRILEKKEIIKIRYKTGYSNHYKLLPVQEWDFLQERTPKKTGVPTNSQGGADSRSARWRLPVSPGADRGSY